jgi:hypothetical protein
MSLFISVLIVACNIVNSVTSTIVPTDVLRITLTLRQPRAPTETPTAAPTPTPQPALDGSAAPAAPASPNVSSPDCYAVTALNTVCLGLVENPFPFPIQHVEVSITLHSSDKSRSVEQTMRLTQVMILAGGSAPYHAAFAVALADYPQVDVSLVRFRPLENPDQFVHLEVFQNAQWVMDGRYEITAVIHNSGQENAEDVRAIVTLQDEQGRVAGYRVTRLTSLLAAGQHLPISIEIIPQSNSHDLAHILTVEGRRVPATIMP